jgi:hypothetical protein
MVRRRPPTGEVCRTGAKPRQYAGACANGGGELALANTCYFLEDAYSHANKFCQLLGARTKSGFFQTLLLRRVGSSMEAGRLTVEKILQNWIDLEEEEDDEESDLFG